MTLDLGSTRAQHVGTIYSTLHASSTLKKLCIEKTWKIHSETVAEIILSILISILFKRDICYV